MKDIIIYIIAVVGISVVIWSAGKFFADKISDYEVISPKHGIECVVVSRMFNTSVDCWKK